MKYILILLCLCTSASGLLGQQDNDALLKQLKENVFVQRKEINSLSKELRKQKTVNQQLEGSIEQLTKKGEKLTTSLSALKSSIELNKNNITTNSEELGTKIQTAQKATDTHFSKLENNQLFWILMSLVALLSCLIIYLFLRKKISTNQVDVQAQIENTKKSIDEESIQLDNKLMELLESQLKLQEAQKEAAPVVAAAIATPDPVAVPVVTQDHSLALKIADETIRIQKNLGRMDAKTKGLKQLNASVKRIQDNFVANGYELVDMLGKDYNEGMKAIVNFNQDDDYEEGKRIITRIIKPQVNYNGTMIQTAQIEVTEA